jgi:tellurite resistance protein TehA-like permease
VIKIYLLTGDQSLLIMAYDIILIGSIFIILYIFSYALYRRNIIKKKLHSKIWSLIFLISFLITFCMGILQAGLIDLGFNISILPDLIFWHGEVGIIFFVVLLFHLQSNGNSLRKLLSGMQSNKN